jgi:hypothetical protein
MASETLTAACGHDYQTPEVSGGSGYALRRDPETGREFRICYACAETIERVEFLGSDRFSAYLSGDGRTLTTWTGGTLAHVTSAHNGRRYWTTGTQMIHGRAIDTSDAEWSFSAIGRGALARLRRIPRKAVAA